MFNIKKIFITSLVASTALTGNTYAEEKEKDNDKPKNVIVLVGDGMGPEFNSAYRHYKDNPETPKIERTAFDNNLLGQMSTDPENTKDENITDSAAAGTAMATGEKTYNGAVSVDNNKNELESVLEHAKKNDKSTGLVVTSDLTDATPAAFGAHEENRNNKNEIAKDYYNEKINGKHKIDVLLGGGANYFGEKNGNLDKKFKEDGYDILTDKQELNESEGKQVLGTFADETLPYAIDRKTDTPSLKDMTSSAIQKMNKNDKGFFLMVEGSQIDKSAHPNDATGVMSEMEDFEQAYKEAIEFAEKDKNTLVVTTGDHSTGGLTMGTRGEQSFHPEAIKQMNHSARYMEEEILKDKNIDKVIKEGYGFKLKEEEIEKIKEAAQKMKSDKDEDYKEQNPLEKALTEPVNERSNTGWTSDSHVGHDTNIYGYGINKDMFEGAMDNTEFNQNLFKQYK
ncbi:alkaline phosphatase [Staphylococcus succinus]|uniref:alkaline phosphatase n=1 Tax=Staphylococcus succinus TaxID=61015 RepID=UPI001C03A3D4|nr:alkaline phosphatase [Staphylococcus succinus]MBU0439332.1 alkaline phosphatase [Staphylococcus succinus]